MSTERSATDHLSRRGALTGIATLGLGVPLLTACSGGADTAAGAGDGGAAGAKPGEVIATTADVEVGGGTIYADAKVVVTQPTAGEFKGFSSTCTHQGCTVSSVSDGTINCLCHGSKFSVKDGSVANGPATKALPEMPVTVTGDQIALA